METESRLPVKNALDFKLLAILVNDIKLDRQELPEEELNTDLMCSAYISEYLCANRPLMLEMLSGNDKVLDRLLVTAFTDPPPPWTSWDFTSDSLLTCPGSGEIDVAGAIEPSRSKRAEHIGWESGDIGASDCCL